MEKIIIVSTFVLIALYAIFGMDMVILVGEIAKNVAMLVFVVWSIAFIILGFYTIYLTFKEQIYKSYNRMTRKSDEFFWKS